jgi:hypothetical protein
VHALTRDCGNYWFASIAVSLFFATLTGVTGCSAASPAEENEFRFGLSPDPQVRARVANIRGEERLRRISIRQAHGTRSKPQIVKVRGPITNAASAALVRHLLGSHSSYWTSEDSWHVEIVGDRTLAMVIVSSCSSGAGYIYSFWSGAWHYDYVVDEWFDWHPCGGYKSGVVEGDARR